MSDLENDLDLYEQLKSANKNVQSHIKKLETQNIPISALAGYIVEQSSGMVNSTTKAIAQFQETLQYDPSPDNVEAFSKLISSSAKLMESLNKIAISHNKNQNELQLQKNREEHDQKMLVAKHKLEKRTNAINTENQIIEGEDYTTASVSNLLKKIKDGEDITLTETTSSESV